MRHIRKQGDGGYYFDKANRNPPQTAEEATNRWSSFRHKQTVLQRLRDEQYQLCCYSEVRADLIGLGYHIEHIENKRQNPARTFDYGNISASAIASDDLAQLHNPRQQAVFGGHASGKQQAVDMQHFVSPRQLDCARFFSFLSDGRIVPSLGLSADDEARATYTINLLNLNSPVLLTERQKWWDELEQLIEQHLQQDMDLQCLATIDLVPRNQALSPFFSLTRQLFGRIAEEVLQHNAPELA